MDWQKNKVWTDLRDLYGFTETSIKKMVIEHESFDIRRPRIMLNTTESLFAKNTNNTKLLCHYISDSHGVTEKDAMKYQILLSRKAHYQKETSIDEVTMGITSGKWSWIETRYKCSHKVLDNKIFDLSRGILFNGKHIYPGYEAGCACGFRVVIPGLDGPISIKRSPWGRIVRFCKLRLATDFGKREYTPKD